MLRDITIGQYYLSDSLLHRLDPRVKIFGVFVFIISVFSFGNLISYVIATIFLLSCIFFSKVPVKYIFRGLKPIWLFLIFTTVLNILFTPGEAILTIHNIKLTKEGIYLSLHVCVRLLYVIAISSVLTLTTTPASFTDALEKIMRPLSKIKFPVHEFAMMMSIALRFIPILVEEADKIMKAQTARGVNFKDKNIVRRLKNMMSLIIPLFISAVRKAGELALAMEARCYTGGVGRTCMRALKYRKRDANAYIIIFLYVVVLLIINFVF